MPHTHPAGRNASTFEIPPPPSLPLTELGSSRGSSISACRRNTFPRHARHSTRSNAGSLSWAITPVTNLGMRGTYITIFLVIHWLHYYLLVHFPFTIHLPSCSVRDHHVYCHNRCSLTKVWPQETTIKCYCYRAARLIHR